MKHLDPELEKLEQRVAPDLIAGAGGMIGVGVGAGVGVGGGGTAEGTHESHGSCGCDP